MSIFLQAYNARLQFLSVASCISFHILIYKLLLFPQAFHLFLVLRRCHRRHEHATRIGDFDQVINNRTMTSFMVRLLVAPL